MSRYIILFMFIAAATVQISAQKLNIDEFNNLSGWKEVASDGARIDLDIETTQGGRYLKIEFEFLGAGYCGIEKIFPLELPDNYKFTFQLKGNSPRNNLEFKLIDESGDNVWWKNQRNFEFPPEWEKIVVKKREIEFAWGPIGGGEVENFEKIQIIIAAAEGGKGTIFLDDLSFEEIPLPPDPNITPIITSAQNVSDETVKNILDKNWSSVWRCKTKPEKHELGIDLQFTREIGGLVIHWDEIDFASDYEILISNDKKSWEKVFKIANNKLSRNFIYLKNVDVRFIVLNLINSRRGKGYGIKEIEIKDFQFSQTPNNFISSVAGYYREGAFPKYFYNKKSYWTIIGVSEDQKEALINEQGMIEVDKQSFSLEPFIQLRNKVLTWNDVQTMPSLEKEYLPIPSVKWIHPELSLDITAFANGETSKSNLLIRYTLRNNSAKVHSGKLMITIRPYQVNPKWQFLNNEGGVAKIKEINFDGKTITINKDKQIIPLNIPNEFGAVRFPEGEIIDYLLKNLVPKSKTIIDDLGFASGCISYDFNLKPTEKSDFVFIIPFYKDTNAKTDEFKLNPNKYFTEELSKEIDYWQKKLDRVNIQLPPLAEKLINALKSNLAYVLINKDGPAIQPGSRSYERSWIRDGALTSSALLRLGLKDEVKNYLDWFSQYQFPSGKIPCVVDKRGADPTPENDSHGEYIYALLQYFQFTRDTSFLRNKLSNVVGAVDFIEYLVNQRKTDQYKKEDSTVFYGIMPESISHEGYSAKPMHSYWDNFFTIKGLRDATEIARIVNEPELQKRFSKLRDEFENNLHNSIKLAIKNHKIDYIPGCAELGDFDATSTTIALFPCFEQNNLPPKELQNTFDKYYEFFLKRMNSELEWVNYTPYELRIVGSFIYLNQPERAHKLLDFFFNDQRPKVWNHWAEVVWKNIDEPRFIGDMPHTWVGSDFINAVRAMFVYEDDFDSNLILGAGLKEEWIDSPKGVSISNLPTYYGDVSYSVKKNQNVYQVEISGDIQIHDNKIVFRNFKKVMPSSVYLNGNISNNFDSSNIIVEKLPARLTLKY